MGTKKQNQNLIVNRRNILQKTSSSLLIPNIVLNKIMNSNSNNNKANAAEETLIMKPSSSNTNIKPKYIPPLITIPNIKNNNKYNKIPRIGYSLYKTDSTQIKQCMNIALNAGVKHFDVGTLYGTNELVGNVLKDYIMFGLPNIDNKGYNIIDNDNRKVANSNIQQ